MTTYEAMELLAGLSIGQKAALVSGQGMWHTTDLGEWGVPPIMVADGPGGVRKQQDQDVAAGEAFFDAEVATCFPPAVALASTWDRDAAEQVGRAIGEEARRQGVSVILGPGINIKRAIRGGRNFEYYSEDPFLTAALGAAWVRGLQSKGVGASPKHFAANSQETDRMRIDEGIDERTLHEIYLRAFRHIVRTEQPWTVMSAYNAINGTFSSENRKLLTEILREEWDFQGLVVSDWGAVSDPVKSLEAGLDLQMPGTGGVSSALLLAAAESGELGQGDLEEAAERVVDLVLKAAAARTPEGEAHFGAVTEPLLAGHNELATAVAADGIVLLKNEGDLLPLAGDAPPSSIAVIGAFAETPRFQGSGSSQVTPWKVSGALDAIRSRLGAEVPYEPGFRLDGNPDEELATRAEALAAKAETVVLFLGLPAEEESEGFDRESIDLPEVQEDLIERLVCLNERIIVVLSNGGVVRLTPWEEAVPSIIEGWLLGQGSGEATARVLFGEVNPSGKLAETIPARLEDTPEFVNFPGEEGKVLYGERILVGYRWYDELLLHVTYPFGHGLSYTEFEYSDLSVAPSDGGLKVSFTVANVGDRDGAEVAQVYVGPYESAVSRAPKELKGFQKQILSQGESRRMEVHISEDDLAYYSTQHGGWVVEEGEYKVEVGSSSRDIRLEADVHVEGNEPAVPLTGQSLLAEWLEHPTAGPKIVQKLAELGMSPESQILLFMNQMPLTAVSTLTGDAIKVDDLTELVTDQ